MKNLFIVLLFAVGVYAAGGDTLVYSAGVEALADGDTFYTETHYAPLKDSIRSIINGRLGNVNLAANANIAATKMDTTGTLKMKVLKPDTIATKGTFVVLKDSLKALDGVNLLYADVQRADIDTLGTISSSLVVTGDIYTTDWANYSSGAQIGWAATPTKTIMYKVVGDLVYINFGITGTSNSASTKFELPYAYNGSLAISRFAMITIDNGGTAQILGTGRLVNGNDTAFCYLDTNNVLATWTATGTKEVYGQFFYEK